MSGAKLFFYLFLIALIPVAFSVGFSCLTRFTKYKKMNKWTRYIVAGLFFGVASILGTMLGVPTSDGAIINVRDAAPIIAGLIIGGPAGIIAGFIGGLYRFVSVYFPATSFFHNGAYTQIACSVSTLMAGVFTAIIRKYIFNNHHGTWYYGFFLGVLIEDFHMMMVFLTHMGDVTKAYETVTNCAIPMIIVNSLAVLVAVLIEQLFRKEKLIVFYKKRKVATKVQITLIFSLLGAYLITSTFSYNTLKNVVTNSTKTTMKNIVDDTREEVDNALNKYVYSVLQGVYGIFEENKTTKTVPEIMALCIEEYQPDEINFVDTQDIIRYCDDKHPGNIGFNFSDPVHGSLINEYAQLNDPTSGINYIIQDLRASGVYQEGNYRYKYAAIKLPSNTFNPRMSYVQIGYNEISYFESLEQEVKDSVTYRRINDKGFLAVCNEQGKIVSIAKGSFIPQTSIIDTSRIVLNDLGGYNATEGNITKTFYTYGIVVEGYYIIGFGDVDECNFPLSIGFLGITLSSVFVFLVAYAVLYIVIKKKVVDDIVGVSDDLGLISGGNLDVQVNRRDSYELDQLSDNINKTVDTLKDYIVKEAQKNAEELGFAKAIQHSVLPSVFPLNNKFEIYASMNTAKEVGGDFYDFYYLDKEHVVIQIADVSGKGIPAAMFMMQSFSTLRALIVSAMPLDEAYTEANKRLCEGNDAQMFVTAWAGIIDLTNGHIEYVNAGHNPPLIGNEEKGFSYLKTKKGFVLGGLEGFKYEKQEMDIAPGDKIFLYTDGVTEANDLDHNLYGEDRLLQCVNKNKKKNAQKLLESISADVDKFVGDAEQSDDITMLCFQMNGKESDKSIVVDAVLENIPMVTDYVEKVLDEKGCSIKAKMQIDVAIDEIFSNIARYGYKPGQLGKAKVFVDFEDNDEVAIIMFEDRGVPYNPLLKKDPNANATLDEREIGGLGIFIVKKTMDDMTYENVNGHNVLTLKKRIK